jgi:hypothetical protein
VGGWLLATDLVESTSGVGMVFAAGALMSVPAITKSTNLGLNGDPVAAGRENRRRWLILLERLSQLIPHVAGIVLLFAIPGMLLSGARIFALLGSSLRALPCYWALWIFPKGKNHSGSRSGRPQLPLIPTTPIFQKTNAQLLQTFGEELLNVP